MQRHHGQAPRDSLLHPVWQATTRGAPDDGEYVARCLLGAGWVGASRRLSVLDLRVWAALCGLLAAQADPAADLDPASARTVETSAYELASLATGSAGGDRYRQLYRSLWRLSGATVTVETVEAAEDIAATRTTHGLVGLVGDVWFATTALSPTDWAEMGALRGSTTLRVEIGRWTAEQVCTGRATWLDLDLLRDLGPGLPARVWAALAAWARWTPGHDGTETTVIGLGRPAQESLGVAQYDRPADARRALSRAGKRIVTADPAYLAIAAERRGGWCLVVRRVAGGQARAALRADARRTRAERQRIRRTATDSLASAAEAAQRVGSSQHVAAAPAPFSTPLGLHLPSGEIVPEHDPRAAQTGR